jgi:hypothetical protein
VASSLSRIQLRGRQWAAQPVRTGFALGQGHAEGLLHQALVTDAGTDAGQRGGDLGIEQWRRHHAAMALERDQVLAGAVHHFHHRRIGQHRRERIGDARGQRIGEQDAALRVVERDLHQRQLRPPGALAHEFCIQADAGRGGGEAGGELGRVADPDGHGRADLLKQSTSLTARVVGMSNGGRRSRRARLPAAATMA